MSEAISTILYILQEGGYRLKPEILKIAPIRCIEEDSIEPIEPGADG